MRWHEATVRVVNEHGLHARPATRFTELANSFKAEIQVAKDDVVVDGKSVLAMLTLNVPCGTELRIRARGTDAARAVQELVKLVASGFPGAYDKSGQKDPGHRQ